MVKKLKIKAGKSYVIFDPNGYGQKKEKLHIESIIPHCASNNLASSIIVYRVWFKTKRYWKYYAEPYTTFAIWNNWERN